MPIGFSQTISQPYIVARMTGTTVDQQTKLGIGNWHRLGVSDSGADKLVNHVYSVERIKTLQYQAKRRLQRLDLHNVSTRHGDGWAGWPTKNSFLAFIIVTAAAQVVPDALVQQLKVGAGSSFRSVKQRRTKIAVDRKKCNSGEE